MTEDDLRTGKLPLPRVFIKRHVFEGGYALLMVIRTPEFVVAQTSSSRRFPPVSWSICPIDGMVGTALELAEEQFYAEHPDHRCSDECNKELREMDAGITSDDITGTIQ